MSPLTHFEEDGVHVFQFHDKSRQAVDAYIAVFQELFTQINAMQYPESVIRAVMDVHEKGLFPLRYAINHSRQVLSEFKFVPQVYYRGCKRYIVNPFIGS